MKQLNVEETEIGKSMEIYLMYDFNKLLKFFYIYLQNCFKMLCVL